MRIFLSRPHLTGSERKHIDAALESNYVAPIGPQIDAFEAKVSDYLDPNYSCVALSSGSAALHLALRISGVAAGDEVWISSMTFAGGIFPVIYLGATPRFFDLSEDSWTINIELLAKQLEIAAKAGRLPKAIVPTDLYGQSCDLDGLEKLSEFYGVRLILDSAESLGANYSSKRKAGTGGDAAILSFNGNKIITTSGGGMLVTKHKEWANEARFLATQARDPAPHYEHSTIGYNYRLSNICAAIGLAQMELLDERVSTRRLIFDRYKIALNKFDIDFMPEPPTQRSTRWLTVIMIDPKKHGVGREEVRIELLKHQIETRPVWKPMHLQPIFEGASYHGRGFDEQLFEQGLCLPSGSDMTVEQQNEVIDRIAIMLSNA